MSKASGTRNRTATSPGSSSVATKMARYATKMPAVTGTASQRPTNARSHTGSETTTDPRSGRPRVLDGAGDDGLGECSVRGLRLAHHRRRATDAPAVEAERRIEQESKEQRRPRAVVDQPVIELGRHRLEPRQAGPGHHHQIVVLVVVPDVEGHHVERAVVRKCLLTVLPAGQVVL